MNRSIESQADEKATPVRHAAPAGQPSRVLDVAPLLLDAYTVDEGHVHLGGCMLDDVPVVRLCYETEESDPPRTFDVLIDEEHPEGVPVGTALAETLGLKQLARAERPRDVSPRDVERLVEIARGYVARTARDIAEINGKEKAEPRITILWCKFATVNLQFTIGEASASLEFSGWARTLEAPPFTSPDGPSSSFHVAATDDGRLVASEDIGVCEASGRRVLAADLARCSVTGKLVADELAARCPVSGERVLESELAECGMCRQLVSPLAIEKDRCTACRRLSTVRRDDSRLQKLLDRYPKLRAWQWYRLAETGSVYILVAAGLLERVLLVADKKTLTAVHLAQGNRLSRSWTAVALDDYASTLA